MPASITKNNRDRIVPLGDQMLIILDDMEVTKHPKDFYLFGSYKYNHKHRSAKLLDFIPGPCKIKRDTATKKWKRLVKDSLGIDVNLYSNKHAGANAKILAGIDLDALREMYGHSSKLMTMRYAKVVKEVYRQQIIDKSPDF